MTAKKQIVGKEVSRMPARRGRFSTAMVGLVAGLALGSCVKDVPVQNPKPAVCAVRAKSTLTAVTSSSGSIDGYIKYTIRQKIIRVGDEFKIPYHFPPKMKLLVADDKGVKLKMANQVDNLPYGQAMFFGDSINNRVYFYFDRCPGGKVRFTVTYPNIPGRNEANDPSLR